MNGSLWLRIYPLPLQRLIYWSLPTFHNRDSRCKVCSLSMHVRPSVRCRLTSTFHATRNTYVLASSIGSRSMCVRSPGFIVGTRHAASTVELHQISLPRSLSTLPQAKTITPGQASFAFPMSHGFVVPALTYLIRNCRCYRCEPLVRASRREGKEIPGKV